MDPLIQSATAPAEERNQRILIIDDNTAMHDDIRKILGRPAKEDTALDTEAAALFGGEVEALAGVEFEIDSAFQGQEGLEMVQRALDEGRPYAMAFVDMRMPPGWDGIETITRIWKINPEVQVVICTAYSDYSWEEIRRGIGQTDSLMILKKPFDNVEVLQLAHTLTRKWQLRSVLVGMNATLAQVRDEADRANKAKSEFLSSMSHELRTPLNAILGFAQLMELDETDESKHESLTQILNGGKHLLELINEILDVARVEAGRLDLSIEPIDLDELLPETLSLMRPLAASRNIQLAGPAAATLTHPVLADRQRLRQVLLNLVSNAIKYNRAGGSVTITCEKAEPQQVRIVVSDTGAGISAEQLQRLFVPFERLDAGNTDIQGTGLGLVLTKGLVEAMGGSIEAESIPGRGTSFSVQLPMAALPAEQAPPQKAASSFDRRVLCIEDDPSFVNLLESILSCRPEITLTAAPDGARGLELARRQRFDSILLDYHLPDMKGHEVFRHLQCDPRTATIPVVVISGDDNPTEVKRLFPADTPAYLAKPFKVPEFFATLDEALATH
jgi:signal transduction histidine kinase